MGKILGLNYIQMEKIIHKPINISVDPQPLIACSFMIQITESTE